jgi:alpha-ketoglutarate-dependent taurine dioxygenase
LPGVPGDDILLLSGIGEYLLRCAIREFIMPALAEPKSWNEVPVVTASGPADELLSVDRDLVISQFAAHGVVLFRSFSIDIDAFRAVVRLYSDEQIRYPGVSRRSVSPDGTVQTVHVSMNPIPLHSELSHTPFRPDICWFYCVRAPSRGSQTTLCDGSLLASALPSSTRGLLESRMLRYRQMVSISYLYRLLGTKDTAAVRELLEGPHGQHYQLRGTEVSQDFAAPALHIPKFLSTPVFANNILHNYRQGKALTYPTFDDGEAIPEDVILSIRDLAKSRTFEIQWRDADLLMFDNTRFMHGRRRIVDSDRLIWTQFSDAGF